MFFVNELAEDGDCNICMAAYGTGCHSDVVRLPCGHLFGSQYVPVNVAINGSRNMHHVPRGPF